MDMHVERWLTPEMIDRKKEQIQKQFDTWNKEVFENKLDVDINRIIDSQKQFDDVIAETFGYYAMDSEAEIVQALMKRFSKTNGIDIKKELGVYYAAEDAKLAALK